MGQTSLSERLRAVEAEIAAGRTDRALTLAQELQAHYPRALAVLRVLGEVYLALRKPREALGALDRVLAGNPEDARACCARAIVQQIQGDSAAALAWYRRACDISPDDQLLRSAYRELASHLGQPPYEPTRMGLARLYLRGDLFAHAIREWESLLAEQPDALEAQLGLAETLWRAGSFHAAEECCARILLNAPSCVKALLILAVIHHDAGRDDEARQLIQRAAEYDPEQRIGLALLADRFAAGDMVLQTLLIGDRPLPGANGASRPLAQSRTTGASPIPSSGTGSRPAMPLTVTDGPAMPPPGSRQPAARDFRTMFAETEYMLWGRETEEMPSLPRQPRPAASADAAGPAARAQAGTGGLDRASTFVPPVLRDQGFNLEETEARVAINFVSWLQAQGARVHGVTGPLPPGTGGTDGTSGTGTLPLPPSRVTHVHTGQTGALPAGPPPATTGPLPGAGGDGGDVVTGPLPPPTQDALRAMFAELGEPQSPRMVEGAIVPTPDATSPHTAPHRAPSASSLDGAGDTPDAWEADRSDVPRPPRWSDSQAGDAVFSDQPSTAPIAPTAPTTPATAADSALRSAGTLEDLERGLADSGFRQIDLQSGQLAALGSAPVGSGAHMQNGGLDALAALDGLDDPAAEVATDALPGHTSRPAEPGAAAPGEVAEPAPDDYPARLDHARRQRADGALDAALVHYRAVLKNAPDLLNEVVGDLRESLADVPEHPEIHRLLGDARIRQGDYLSALESYNRAVALTNAHED
jgi:tetratricopeptide (TPR) repeat protein